MPNSVVRRYLAVILGMGFIYRLLYYAKRQLSTEELMQALAVRSDSVQAILSRLCGGACLATPLDSLVQRAVVFFAGEYPWALRIHAVIFGALSVWLFFRIARFLFGDRVALYSAALFALYPLHHHYSQEGSPYALTTFLTLISFDLLLKLGARVDAGWRPWLSWTCAQILLLYAGFAGIAVLFSQGTAMVLSRRWKSGPRLGAGDRSDAEDEPDLPRVTGDAVLKFAGCAALACAVFAPWTRVAWVGHTVPHPESPNFRLIFRIVKELGDGSYPFSGMMVLGVAIGVAAMLGHGRRQSLLWLSAWFVLPLPFIYLMDRWAGSPLIIGQLLPITPPLILLAGYGMSYLGERLRILDRLPFQLASPALVYAAALATMSVAIALSHWRREPVDWLGAARYLQEAIRTGDELMVPAGFPLLEYYAPSLSQFDPARAPAGSVTPLEDRPARRIMVCLGTLRPDPCARIRTEAKKDRSWTIREFSGLTIISRD